MTPTEALSENQEYWLHGQTNNDDEEKWNE